MVPCGRLSRVVSCQRSPALTGCGTASARDDLPRSILIPGEGNALGNDGIWRQHLLDVKSKTNTAFIGLRQLRNYAHQLDIAALPFMRERIGQTRHWAKAAAQKNPPVEEQDG